MIDEKTVIACKASGSEYPRESPFHPAEPYPEYDGAVTAADENHVYEAVRESFRLTELDKDRFGTPQWNPLEELIREGETVLLKPNLVKEYHPRDPQGWRYVLTHGSIIRAVADYVFKAVGSGGTVIIADAPQTDSSFDKIRDILGLNTIQEFYQRQGFDCRLVDLRKEEWREKDGVIVSRRKLDGDPCGYVSFDLADDSEFVGHAGGGNYYGADYDAGEVNRHHSGGRHEYMIAGTAIEADVIFSLPKLKTHKKAGITVSLKNLIGVNGDKNWLPHHTEAGDCQPGDEHPCPGAKHKAERAIVQRLRYVALRIPWLGPQLFRLSKMVGRRVFGDTESVIRSGNWWGNDTIWRTCLDLNKIVMYGNTDGTLRSGGHRDRKRHFVLADGIIAGEGRGPLNPDPVSAGVVVFGTNPASVDAACACLMGFDVEKISIVRQAFSCRSYPLVDWDWQDVRLVSHCERWCGLLPEISKESTLHFEPHFGWKGHIERDDCIAK